MACSSPLQVDSSSSRRVCDTSSYERELEATADDKGWTLQYRKLGAGKREGEGAQSQEGRLGHKDLDISVPSNEYG